MKRWYQLSMLQLLIATAVVAVFIFINLRVTPTSSPRVFSKHGIQAREVLHYKSHRPLESVVQLCVPETTVQAELTSYGEVCTVCGKGKCHWPVRGFFPRLDRTEQLPIFKTQTTFGSGGASGRAIIVSQKLYSSIVENRLRRCYFQPVDTNMHAAEN